MADVFNETLQEIAKNETSKPKATTEGMMVAYSSLVIMACLPVFFGAFRSIKCLQKQKDSGEKAETMSKKDAAMFPFIASGALVGLYVFFKLFSKEYINLLVSLYFFGLGVLSLTHLLSPFVSKFIPKSLQVQHHIVYTKGVDEAKEEMINYKFGSGEIVAFGLCSLVGCVYMWNKHWIVNNIFGIAFAVNGVEFLHLNNIMIGCTLLGGLFIYDIFWVFATDVMVTVAKSFEAPIKLVFPQDLLENWLHSSNFAMLGLGDIVIPGIFIALLLRFDESLNRGKKTYFYSSFIAYFLGLVLTIFIMTYFKHAQPALLYLVPACIGIPGIVAIINGDLNALLKYEDHPEESEEKNESAAQSKKSE